MQEQCGQAYDWLRAYVLGCIVQQKVLFNIKLQLIVNSNVSYLGKKRKKMGIELQLYARSGIVKNKNISQCQKGQ